MNPYSGARCSSPKSKKQGMSGHNSLPSSVHWRFLMEVTFNSLDFFLGRHAWTCQIPSNRRIYETYTPEKLRWSVGKQHDFQNCSCKKPPIVSFPIKSPHLKQRLLFMVKKHTLLLLRLSRKKRVGKIDEINFLGCQISDHVIKWAFTKLTFEVYVDHFDPITE